jgi:hypothetical protein
MIQPEAGYTSATMKKVPIENKFLPMMERATKTDFQI